jgi:hypothetical protein
MVSLSMPPDRVNGPHVHRLVSSPEAAHHVSHSIDTASIWLSRIFLESSYFFFFFPLLNIFH